MLHAVIMAGGAGTRFWPASRRLLPKQLLRLTGSQTLLQATVARLEGLVPLERMLVLTNQALTEAVRDQLPGLPATAILGEPCKRDTAPCIGLAAALLSQQDADATMIVMPSDHRIEPLDKFAGAVTFACQLVEESPGRILTFGIRPTYAAETFGYIERCEPLGGETASAVGGAYRVKMFREKPLATVAEQYLESGRFYWNSGIFVWKARTVLEALARFEPEMHDRLQRIAAAFGSEHFAAVFETQFTEIRGKSIDYAVMERHDDVAVIEAQFEWDDVGSWGTLARSGELNEHGNSVEGRHIGVRTHGCIIRTDDQHLVATLGLEDCIVVHTADATLVARRSDEEAIRQIVGLLEKCGWTEYL